MENKSTQRLCDVLQCNTRTSQMKHIEELKNILIACSTKGKLSLSGEDVSPTSFWKNCEELDTTVIKYLKKEGIRGYNRKNGHWIIFWGENLSVNEMEAEESEYFV